MNASLIISFYNKIEYLKLIFAGLAIQSEKRFEVLIADDGSSDSIVDELEILATTVDFPLFHLHQEDKGFRKNRILNKCISAANSGYIIFIDGDCIPHPQFVREHITNATVGKILTGRRVNLSESFTNSLTYEKISSGILQRRFYSLMVDGVFGKSYDVEKGIYIKNQILRKFINRKKRGILGCNFSAFKSDLLSVNGFDERYEAPSIGEDSDIQYRLELSGKEIVSLNNIAIQYHLYHKLQPRPEANLRLFEEVKKEKKAFTPFGIKQG